MGDLTFLMNRDPAGSPNPFYALAKQYFDVAGSTVIEAPPGKSQTIEGVFTALKALKVKQGTINLVSHAVGFGAIEGALTLADQAKGRAFTIADDLQDALAAKSLAPPGPAIITDTTRVVLYGCDVGRSLNFLTLLSGLFGNPGELLAPRRLSVFMSQGSKVKYRQAKSWSLARKPPQLLAGAAAPTGGWAAYRTKFVTDADFKFGRIAIPNEPPGVDRLQAMLMTAATNATTAMGPSFFLQETFNIFPSGSQTAAEAAASVKPISNGEPPKALPTSALELDDTTVVTTIGPDDAFAANAAQTQFAIAVVLLAQVIDQEVLIAEGPNYARVTTSPGLAPSPGPRPVGGGSAGGSGAGASNEPLQNLVDQLLADGAAQADVDELVALVPTGDAIEGLATDAADDVPDPEDGIALLLPTPQGELA